ncbi:hypothetical protein Pta02_71760 [Planobispora takensis]|uniref:Uncharacterized protein n=1 Tax=Planobispora takensis TaxID=1367882 RepID=A0A8J3WXU0_9ACTN|nr:hypothetical protein Pta02_71760 [Planobispora takensis]
MSPEVLSPLTLTASTSRHAAATAATADMIFVVSGRSRPRAVSDRRADGLGTGVVEGDMAFLHGEENEAGESGVAPFTSAAAGRS